MEKVQALMKDKYVELTTYARKELKLFHSQYTQEINHLMGFLVQLDTLAAYFLQKPPHSSSPDL